MDTDDVDFEESYEDGSDMFEAVGNSSNTGAELLYDQTAVDFFGLSISSSNSKSTTAVTVEEPVEDGGNASYRLCSVQRNRTNRKVEVAAQAGTSRISARS